MSSVNGGTTIYPRAGLLALITSALCFPHIYQASLSRLWQILYDSKIYQASYFETLFTVLCYAIIEPLYTYKFGHNGHLRIDVRSNKVDAKGKPLLPRMMRPSRRLGEMFVYAGPLLLMDLVMVKKFANVPLVHIVQSAGYPINHLDKCFFNATAGDMNINPSFLLPSIHSFSWESPLQIKRALPPDPPTSRRVVSELATAFFIYDSLFFLAHLAFHKIKPLAQLHEPHHRHTEMHPQVTNRLSVGERLILVMLANFSLNIIGSHAFTRTCFIPIFVYLFVEVHCGMDLPWGYDKILPSGWGLGAKAHAHHHKTGQGTYAPFFGWWDAGLSKLPSCL